MAVTWNPADKSASITLSNGNLTCELGVYAFFESVRATEGKAFGKWYFEADFNPYVAYKHWIGVGQSTASLGKYTGDDPDSWGFWWPDYDPYLTAYNGPGTDYSDINMLYSSPKRTMIAVDMDTGKIWIGLDGYWLNSANPAAGTGAVFSNLTGTVYPMASLHQEVGTAKITGYFASADLSHTPPTGFLAWDSAPVAISNDLPAESLIWTSHSFTQSGNSDYHRIPAESLIWTEQAPVLIPFLPAESLSFAAQPLTVPASLPTESLIFAAQPLGIIFEATDTAAVRAVYRAYLTGDAEDPPIADLELPLASFQSRRRNGEQTYLSITVPNPTPYIDGINARLNGDIVIKSGYALGSIENLTELLRVNFGSFRYDLGATSGTASLSGHKQVTYSNPKTRTLAGISYKSVTDGVMRVRCEPDMWLAPGDTADIGDSTFVVDSISYTIKPTSATMEVQEVSE